LAQTRGDSPGEPAFERLVRGVIGEEGKPGLEAQRAASPVIRHERLCQLVTAAILGCRSKSFGVIDDDELARRLRWIELRPELLLDGCIAATGDMSSSA
jgi:hypothetical protein